MTEELIKFTPGERPAHIGPDELVQLRRTKYSKWSDPFFARDAAWNDDWEYRVAPMPPLTDDQLEAECDARGWTVTKPLVTQAERDRLADALAEFDLPGIADQTRVGLDDERVRAFIDTYEGAKS